jgi:hypothetical protein
LLKLSKSRTLGILFDQPGEFSSEDADALLVVQDKDNAFRLELGGGFILVERRNGLGGSVFGKLVPATKFLLQSINKI